MLNPQPAIWLHSLRHHRNAKYLGLAVHVLSHLDTMVTAGP